MIKAFHLALMFTFLCAFALGISVETSGMWSLGFFFLSVVCGCGAAANYAVISNYRMIVKDVVIHNDMQDLAPPELAYYIESNDTINEWVEEGREELERAKQLVQNTKK
jgi:hypothetical protein